MSVLGRRQIDRLGYDDLARECEQRGIVTASLNLAGMRKRLKCARFCTPRLLEDLACPVCQCTPHPDDVLLVCSAGHHMCFACILGIYQLSSRARHRCPMRCGELRVTEPGHLLKCLVQGVGAHVMAEPCALHAQYRALHTSGFFQQLPLAHRRLYGKVELRKFARLQEAHPVQLEQFIHVTQQVQTLRTRLLTALRPGENAGVDLGSEQEATRPSHTRFHSSSSSSSTSAETSSSGSDVDVVVEV